MMSPERKLLERIIRHFEKQGRFARTNNGCVYRQEVDGRVVKCALGCFIPKSMYDPVIEDTSLYSTFASNHKQNKLREILEELGLFKHKHFLGEMQRLHDDFALGRCVPKPDFDKYMTELKNKREVYV